MGNFLEAARDLRRIVDLEPENKQVADELDELTKNKLSESDKRVLEQEREAGSKKSQQESTGEFKRLNIVEDDDDEEEQEEQQEAVPAKQQLVANGVATHEIKVTELRTPEVAEKPVELTPSIPKPVETKQEQPVPAPIVPQADKSVFIKELRKRQDVKQRAVDEIKKAMFEDAINLMKKELDYFDEDDIRLVGLTPELKLEYYSLKMSFHANMALCYAQIDLPKKVVEFCDIVLESFEEHAKIAGQDKAEYSILEKTLMRKALALEKCDKFRDARVVYNEIRQRFPSNMQASQGVHRCDDYLGDRLVDFSPSSSNISPSQKLSSPVLDKITSPVSSPAPPQPTPKQPMVQEIIEKETSTASAASTALSLEHFEKLKADGNNAFKKSDFQKAFEIFTKIISSVTLAHPELDKKKEDQLCQLLVSVLSNRAMTCAKIGKFYQGIEDCNRILTIDSSNAKAYHRRFVCQEEIAAQLRAERKQIREQGLVADLLRKEKDYIEAAIADLGTVMKHTKEADYKLKNQELLGIRDSLAIELEKISPKQVKPVVQVLESKEEAQIEEKKPAPEVKKPQPAAPAKPQRPDANLDIDAITVQALDAIISSSTLPNNASKFEVELKSFKTHYLKMWQYFTKFGDNSFLAKLYEKREMEASVVGAVVNCLSAVLANE